MTKKAIAGLAMLGLLIGISSPGHAADLITNGDFEITTGNTNGQLGYNVTATGWSTTGYNFLFNSTGADGPGVTGSDGSLQLWGPGNGVANGLTSSPTGGNFVAADGAYLVGPITQTVSGLTIGDTYELGFDWAGAQQSGFRGDTTEQWQVSLGADTQSTTVLSNADQGFTGWQHQTFDYVASSTSEVLSFLAVGTPTGKPPFSLLDGVTMSDVTVASTPEPSAIAAMFAGVIGVGAFVRRRSRTKKSAQ